MTQPLCRAPSCRGPYPAVDGFVCRSCVDELAGALRAIPEVIADLLVNMTRQDVGDMSLSSSGSDEVPLLFRPEATETGRDLHGVLATWVRHLLEARGLTLEELRATARPDIRTVPIGPQRPPVPGKYTHPAPAGVDTTSGRLPGNDTIELARWLARHLETVRADEAGGELVDELIEAVARCRYVTDRPADRIYLGTCEQCVQDAIADGERLPELWTHPEAVVVRCHRCQASYNVQARRAWLLECSRDLKVTAELASRALPALLDVTLTPEMIRGLHRYRGLARFAPLRQDPHRRYRYRVGDVVDMVAEIQATAARRAAGVRARAARPPVEQLPPEMAAAVGAMRAAAASNTTAVPAGRTSHSA